MIVVCTSKPFDGLFYYSYEYSRCLDVPLVIITYPGFSEQDYINSIQSKYTIYKDVYFDFTPINETAFILGRSALTLAYLNRNQYTYDQLLTLHLLFGNQLISVYSENHPVEYENALKYFNPIKVRDLCDYDVYPNGVGDHFEKRVNFEIYKEPVPDVQFENLFLGTNKKYYETVEQVLPTVLGTYGILTCNGEFVNKNLNNIFAPVENLLGLFNTYVYTKSTFDPAPRLIQECMYFGKKILYNRNRSIRDGGSVYYARKIKKPTVEQLNDII